MLRRGCYPALALAVMAASLAGCSSPAARRPLPEKGSAAVAPAVERASDAAADKVAQGHAHYAAAVIHEMNDEAGAALEDYYEAALAHCDELAVHGNCDDSRRAVHLGHAAAFPGRAKK